MVKFFRFCEISFGVLLLLTIRKVFPHLIYFLSWNLSLSLDDVFPLGAPPLQVQAERIGLFSLEKRRLQRDIAVAFQYLKGTYSYAEEGLFIMVYRKRMRGNGFKLEDGRFRLDTRNKLFTGRVVRHCNRLPREAVDAPPWKHSRPGWMGPWAPWSSAWFSGWQPCPQKGGWNQMIFEVLSTPSHSLAWLLNPIIWKKFSILLDINSSYLWKHQNVIYIIQCLLQDYAKPPANKQF